MFVFWRFYRVSFDFYIKPENRVNDPCFNDENTKAEKD